MTQDKNMKRTGTVFSQDKQLFAAAAKRNQRWECDKAITIQSIYTKPPKSAEKCLQVEIIDAVHKWLLNHYSLVLVQISQPILIVIC